MGRSVRVFALWRWVNGGASKMVSFREMVVTRKGKKNEGKAGESLSFRANLRRERERENDSDG